MDTLESIPGLAIWKNILIIGDTKGVVTMLYLSGNKFDVLKSITTLSGISYMDISNDGALLALSSWDRCIKLLETKTLNIKHIMNDHSANIIDVKFNFNCNHLITTSNDGNSYIWDIKYP